MNVNIVVESGRLTADPVVKYLQSGTAVCNFSLANNYSVKRNEKWEQVANFFNCVVFGKQAENLEKYCKKGKALTITGELRQDRWDDSQTGQKRTAVKIMAKTIEFHGDSTGKGKAQSQTSDQPPDEAMPTNFDDPGMEPTQQAFNQNVDNGEASDTDDIPF